MIHGKRVLAIVPARGGSKGLPRKNVRPLGGRPLVAWPIAAATAASSVDRVIVSTDDAEIARAARLAGGEVPFTRPAELATDTASSVSVVRHALDTLAAAGEAYEYVVLLEPTSPLTEAIDIDDAVAHLHGARHSADAIVGVCAVHAAHPDYDVRLGADGIIRPYLAPDFASLKRRQDVEALYFLDGSLYCSAVDEFYRRGTFYHERTLGYVMPRWKSFEVDDLVDFICIEAILARRDELRRPERTLPSAQRTDSLEKR